ncbi:hypothetical protein [Curtobacterium phage Parvaparticeps]|nr:hypothetical protein [Curtobacterium phage Parvaparticeps]
MKKSTDEQINEKAFYYNQCRARRRRVLRAIRKNQRKVFAPAAPQYPTENQRWAQIYDLRLMEVDSEIHEIESDPEFFRIQPRALGYRSAPYAAVAFALGMVATIVAVVLFR